MVTIAQLDFDHLYILRTTQGQPWPLALGSEFLISPTDPGPAGPRDLASPTDPGPAGPGILWPCRARAGPDGSLAFGRIFEAVESVIAKTNIIIIS